MNTEKHVEIYNSVLELVAATQTLVKQGWEVDFVDMPPAQFGFRWECGFIRNIEENDTTKRSPGRPAGSGKIK